MSRAAGETDRPSSFDPLNAAASPFPAGVRQCAGIIGREKLLAARSPTVVTYLVVSD
jgi:hypothetical protein